MNKSVLKRYFSNELTDAEKAVVLNWMKDPVNNAAIKEWMKETWETISANHTDAVPNVKGMWENIQSCINHKGKMVLEDVPVVPQGGYFQN